MENDKKKASFYILNILKEYSDENHLLKQSDIIDLLKKNYGITLERKTVGSTIGFLRELGYDISDEENSKKGVCLLKRNLDITYVQYLIDSVYSNKYIGKKDTKDIINALTNDLSKYDKERLIFLNNLDKNNTFERNFRELFFNIDKINEAIDLKKKIEFNYVTFDASGKIKPRHDGQIYKVSPYFMINNQAKYYLVCDSDEKKLYNYRMEYIRNVSISDEDIVPIKEMKGYTNKQNYINEHIYMFAGNTINAKVLIKNQAYTYIYEWFGKKASIENIDGLEYAFIRTNENALFYWLLQYMKEYEIIEPVELRNRVIETLKSTLESYQN